MAGLKESAAKSAFWALAENIGMRGITFLAFLVLARLLDKSSFGLVALAAVYVAFLELVVRVGVTQVIVQRKTLSELDKNTAFWTAAGLGLVALLLSYLAAPYAASWSGEAELESVLHWLTLGIIPLSLTRVHDGIMMRDMRFKGLAARRILGSASGAVVGVTCAFNGLGVWSLVAQQLTDRVVDFLTLYWVTRWYPRFNFSWLAFRDMADYGGKVMGTNVAYFATSQADKFLIGHFLGIDVLGVYVVGLKLIEVLFVVMSTTVARVALAAFSKIQTDTARLRKACLSVGELAVFTGIPAFMFLAVAGSDINHAVFGEKWSDSAIIVQIMAVVAVPRLVSIFLIPALNAKGAPGRVMASVALQALTSSCFAALLSPFGLAMMTVGWAVGYVASAFILTYFAKRSIEITTVDLGRVYAAPFIAGLMSVVLVIIADSWLLYSVSIVYIAVIIKLCIFVLAYGVALYSISPQILKDGYTAISGLFLRRRA